MLRRDYILKLIERFAQALIALRNQLMGKGAGPAEALPTIREIAADAGLDLTVARALDPASLLMWLAPTADIDAPRLWLMAELLYLEALRGRSEEGLQWRADAERALAIASRLEPGWRPAEGLATPAERVTELRQMLSRRSSPPEPSSTGM